MNNLVKCIESLSAKKPCWSNVAGEKKLPTVAGKKTKYLNKIRKL
jgi:hypothetical protein